MMGTKTSDRELIEEYIREVYIFTSNIDGWCIKERNKNWFMLLHKLICDLEKIFPDMGAKMICTEWYNKNVRMVEDKINHFLSQYHLQLGNKPTTAWDVVNQFGRELNIWELMTILPRHHNEKAILKIYDKWFEEQQYNANWAK